MKKYFINLTNGIEFIDKFDVTGIVRIQSTLLEAKKWDRIISELDYTFLLNVASGDEIFIIDSSRHKPQSRAIYQGIPWIVYVLNRRWFDIEKISFVKKVNCTKYFSKCYHSLTHNTKKKLDYVSKFLNCNKIQISGISLNTENDGNYDFYTNKISEFL